VHLGFIVNYVAKSEDAPSSLRLQFFDPFFNVVEAKLDDFTDVRDLSPDRKPSEPGNHVGRDDADLEEVVRTHFEKAGMRGR
jgi:hypothetical protein